MRFLMGLFVLILATRSSVAADGPVAAAETLERPNIVVIFCDDLGYGDLGCFGHPTIATPELDRMAREGTKLTQFYVSSSVCTPSRAGLLTGRLPQRSGMWGNRRVLFPDSVGGLPASELTIAEKMKEAGYATGCIGKWHLGHLPEYLPTEHGFDSYFGIPYSNDMDRIAGPAQNLIRNPRVEAFNVPLLEGRGGAAVDVVERPADQRTITRRYTEKGVEFIREHRDEPFFLYLAHSMPHVPLFRSEAFADRSLAGIYGDVIEELDWSVGQILAELREQGLDEKTMVVFTSDNGPWLVYDRQGGSAGLLRDGKGSTWEGGMREPTLVWWPGSVPAGVTSTALSSTLDLLPTFCRLAKVDPPRDRTLDGYDLTAALIDGEPSPRESFFYYRGDELMAVRHGDFKAHLITRDGYGPGARQPQKHDPPLLYHLGVDPGEQWDVAQEHPEVLAKIAQVIQSHRAEMKIGESQLDRKN